MRLTQMTESLVSFYNFINISMCIQDLITPSVPF